MESEGRNLCPETSESIAIHGSLSPNTHSLWWMEDIAGEEKWVESEESIHTLSR